MSIRSINLGLPEPGPWGPVNEECDCAPAKASILEIRPLEKLTVDQDCESNVQRAIGGVIYSASIV